MIRFYSIASIVGTVAITALGGGCSSDPGSATGGGGTGESSSTATSGSGTGGSGTGGTACAPVDDQNPCTDDVCNNGGPKSKPVAAGTPCSMGGTYCDGMGACVAPVCLGLSKAPSPSVDSPTFVAAADLNGDGKPDLVTANFGPNGSAGSVSMLLNQGNGTFAPKVDYLAGVQPASVAVADVDGDGKTDLVTANGNKVNVLLNKGDGTFAAPISYAADSSGFSSVHLVQAADLNGDGKPDLVTLRSINDLSSANVLLNKGDGTFAAPVSYAAGWSPYGVAAADLDGDGKPDLAVANFGNNDPSNSSVSVLFNLGNGTFAAPINYVAVVNPTSIVASDLNGDGKPDLAVLNGASMGIKKVSVLFNLGNGTFAAAVNYPVGYVPKQIVAADLNGDSKPDLAIVNTDTDDVSVLVNLGNGTFAPRVDHAVGDAPFGIAAADLDGDGRTDLATADGNGNTVTLLLNTCPP